MLDCFEGQIISGVVIVVFVIMFLLREWVIQNQEHEGLRMGMNDGAAPVAAEEAEGHGFVEHAVERLIAVQHHIEAVVEGEADLSDEEEEVQAGIGGPESGDDQNGVHPHNSGLSTTSEADIFTSLYTQPGSANLMHPQNRPNYLLDGVPPGPYEHARFFWESENASSSGSSGSTSSSLNPAMAPFGSWPGEAGSAAGSSSGVVPSTLPVRPVNERAHSSDPTTQAFASTNTLDKSGRRPPAVESRLGRDISFTAPEDILSLGDRSTSGTGMGYVYDPVNQTYHP